MSSPTWNPSHLLHSTPLGCYQGRVWVPWVMQQIPIGDLCTRQCMFPCYFLHTSYPFAAAAAAAAAAVKPMCQMPEALAPPLTFRMGRRQTGCHPGLPGQRLGLVVSESWLINLSFYSKVGSILCAHLDKGCPFCLPFYWRQKAKQWARNLPRVLIYLLIYYNLAFLLG